METTVVNNENRRRKKADDRRSSILKIDRPTLADLDVNKKTETKLSRRASKRVSFAETYQVKEFPKDSPQRWLRDLHNAESDDEEKGSESKKAPAGGDILGLDQLLNGQIQNTNSTQNEEQKLNKTILDGADMEETICADTSIRQNTTLPSDNMGLGPGDKKVDTMSFLNNLMNKSKSESEPFLKFPDDSDEEEYKASSFFRGGGDSFFSSETATGKIDNKSFLAKLQSINNSSKQFALEREQREKAEDKTVVFDGMDGDMEMTTNFTATLESFKKRQSVGNVLESTRIYSEGDGMDMTRNLTTNIEVIRSNLPISEFDSSKVPVPKTAQSNLGVSTMLGSSAARGFDQTRVFSNYEDPTANMDLTVARGEILGNSGVDGSLQSGPHIKSAQPCPEVTVHFGQQEVDADMEMTEALNPTLVIMNDKSGASNVKVNKNKPNKPKALADVTAHFEGEGRLNVPGRKRSSSISPVDMGKENVTLHFKPVDSQADMDFTSCLTTKVESVDKENVVIQQQTRFPFNAEHTQVFTGADNVANMELTACIETHKSITMQVDETISFKRNIAVMENTSKEERRESEVTQIKNTRSENDPDDNQLVSAQQGTRGDKTTATATPEEEEKTRVFNAGDMTAAMELTECVSFKPRPESGGTVISEDQTVHFEKRGGSMELTAVQTELVSAPPASEDEKTRMFSADEETAAMEMTRCLTSVVHTEPVQEYVDKEIPISEASKSDQSFPQTQIRGSQSLPNRVDDVTQAQAAELKEVQQRRSLYGATSDGFTAQSLKRKLYSFDMLMAGAKARSVKVAKLKDSEVEKDKGEDRAIELAEKLTEVKVEQPKESNQMSEKITASKLDISEDKTKPKSDKPSTSEVPENTHTSTEILKLGTSETEVSALEVLKNLALEEDTLDDTKLLELRMLARKNSSDKLQPVAESPNRSPQCEGNAESENLGTSDPNDNSLAIAAANGDDKDEDDDDDGVTQYNTTTALAMLLSKMNSTKITKPSQSKSLPASPGSSEAPRSATKHSSPDPICAGNKKKAKYDEKKTTDKGTSDGDDATLNSIELPNDLQDGDTVTSLESGGSESGEDHTRGVHSRSHSQSAMSLSQSLLSYSLLDKKSDETDGPWNFQTFCERIGVSQFQPRHHRRSSINIQQALETERLQDVLRHRTITQTEMEVKGEIYQELRNQLDRDEVETQREEQKIEESQPALFNKLRNSEITPEEVHSSYKACQRWAKAQLKRERVTVSKQCLEKLKAEKERLCSGFDEVVTQAERVVTDLASIDTMLEEIDKQLEEVKLEPALSESEAQEVNCLQEQLQLKSLELKKHEEEKAEQLRLLSERKGRERHLEAECQRQELQLMQCEETAGHCLLVEELHTRLAGLERVLEWKAKELSPERDVFIFLYGAVKLTVTYDIIQHKTLDSVTVTSHLAATSSPWSLLVCRLIQTAVDGAQLRASFPSRDKLPQLLHMVSNMVSAARSLASEISHIDLDHRVIITDNSMRVSLINPEKIRKVVLTFEFGTRTISTPSQCLVDIVIGSIQKDELEDIVKSSLKEAKSVTMCVARVQDFLNS